MRVRRAGAVRPPEGKSAAPEGRMVKSGEVLIAESLLYGCAPWTPLKRHYNKLRITYSRVLL